MDGKDKNQAQQPHQHIQDKEKDESSPIPLIMRIVILFDKRMEYFFMFHWAQEFSS